MRKFDMSYTGIPKDELVLEKKDKKQKMSASVQTAKTTLGHSATESARDSAYKVCIVHSV